LRIGVFLKMASSEAANAAEGVKIRL